MKERGIIFSAPMIQAERAGNKTITRRSVKPQPDPQFQHLECFRDGTCEVGVSIESPNHYRIKCPYGAQGDRLYVKETYYAFGYWEQRWSEKKGRDEWHFVDKTMENGYGYLYAADLSVDDIDAFQKKRQAGVFGLWKRPAIFMPRAVSRTVLEITQVFVERLNDITPADALEEGILYDSFEINGQRFFRDYRLSDVDASVSPALQSPVDSFMSLWESINGENSYQANPWVWAIRFKRVSA